MAGRLLNTMALAELRYVSTVNPEDHTVPSDRFAESLGGIQKILDLIPTLSEDDDSGRNSKSKTTGTTVRVFVGAPSFGNFCLPLEIKPLANDLYYGSSGQHLVSDFWKILLAIKNKDSNTIGEIIPEELNFKHVLRAIKAVFNSFDQEYLLELNDRQSMHRISSNEIESPFQQLYNRFASEVATFPVFLGNVTKINFKNKTVSLTDPKTNKLVTFPYWEEHEQVLKDSARKFVEVHGEIHKDEADNITKVKNLINIIPVDLTDMNIKDLLPPFLEPNNLANVSVTIELSESKSVYFGTYEDLEIFAGGLSRASIESEIRSEISVLWRDLVQERYTELTPYAQHIKETLQELFKETSYGV